MLDEQVLAMARYRFDLARKTLRDAERNMNADAFACSANRSYYAVFHAMRTLLALERFDAQRHDTIISEFRRRFIKTGVIPVEHSKIIGEAFDLRIESDYQDFYIVSKNDVATQFKNAQTFLAAVEEYLSRVAPEALTINVDIDGGGGGTSIT